MVERILVLISYLYLGTAVIFFLGIYKTFKNKEDLSLLTSRSIIKILEKGVERNR